MAKHVFLSGLNKTIEKVSAARRFAKDEDGGVFTIFVLVGFLIILATTGIGVDLMHYERDRANLQSTLDRAVLAAADLDQKLPPKQVVEAYLEKAGLQGKLTGDPVVVEGNGSRSVTATAQTVVNTHFMRLSGYPTLTAKATSTAEESVGAVEISLVLDMSHSMSSSSAEAGKSKIQVLREATKKFVKAMLDKENADKISISIIPYATQVNAGADILDKFTNVSSEHDYSHCINFTSSQFNSAELDPTTSLERTAHFDVTTNSVNPIKTPICPVRAGSEITPITDDITVLNNRIEALTPKGSTSIDIGMKWGSALLDPKFKDIINALATGGIVPNKFDNRPLDYDEDVLKIIIVMTDGQNSYHYKLRSDLRDGQSDVWYNPDYVGSDDSGDVRGEFSVRKSQNPPRYYWSRQRVTKDHRYGDEEPGDAVRLTYPELYNLVSVHWNAVNNYGWQPNYRQNWYQNVRSIINASTKNTRTTNICTATKSKGVIVYGIAFEAPAAGLTTIKNCASSDSHVYIVNNKGNLGENNTTLEEAFESIASSVRKLRLTQ